jgi:putative ABC transport system permease protein
MIVKVSLKSLLANKLRSFLAMLGIIIGVGAVIAMLAIGAGAQKQVLEQMSAMGTNLLVVRPGQRGSGGVMSGTQQTLTVDDAMAIARLGGDVAQVAPAVSGSTQTKHLNLNARTTVMGTTTTYFSIRNFELQSGSYFTDADEDRMARVGVIGPTAAENLFGAEDPIGQQVKVNGINFRIIGVNKSKGDQGWFNPDDQMIIPITTAMKQLFGLEFVREINIQVREGGDIDATQEAVRQLLRKRHRLQQGVPDDFFVRNQAEMLKAASDMSATFTFLIGGIAGISLLVGGIGIMNIMLVTVTERTREIGVRKAIGARDADILRQFLIEAVIMSALGGMIGVLLGYGGAWLIASKAGYVTIVTPLSVFMSLGFAGFVGVFFGYYPAWRASKLDPIEALRYE